MNHIRLNYKNLDYLMQCLRWRVFYNSRCVHFASCLHSIKSNVDDIDFHRKLRSGPSLQDFIKTNDLKNKELSIVNESLHPYIDSQTVDGTNRKVYIQTYGCQMNVNDTEIVWAILEKAGYCKVDSKEFADVILVVTCAIREGAEQKIWHLLDYLKSLKRKRKSKFPLKVGVLGCMAERLKMKLLEADKAVDIVAGPDSYRDLPRLLSLADDGQEAVNVILSLEETYADITPVRINPNSPSAFVSIMRGCDNMCSYCIVPFTRGRERSRPVSSILDEIRQLSDKGIKEVTLLGQNVNSYRDISEANFTISETSLNTSKLAEGFRTLYKPKVGGLRFADLLEKASSINPNIRIRFTSPHPKDFPDEVLQIIQDRPNICNSLHLPAQSGNTQVLERMRRGYTREAYLNLVHHIRNKIPGKFVFK
ncbi:CDK5 regulatory subunit-associated protein 1-like [Centruroides sculpturatus]|uniref:CDK5 regulatory subunit-associated protein 1-like n=1 Tax=Centruroides sculpturatus TaxID=218467 RepID=UPI000C6ECC0F|nr:CDK5 regulatory subunit-associated protein 1-like [Centruroides sculpturatus]